MFYTDNILRILKYFLFGTLTLSPLCFAAVETELNGENRAEFSLRSPRRLQSGDDDYKRFRSESRSEAFIYMAAAIIIFIVSVCCKVCCKYLCQEEEGQEYSNRIVHRPPRSRNFQTVPVAPSSSSRPLAPPRDRPSTLILPLDAPSLSVDAMITENLNINSSTNQSSSIPPSAPSRPSTSRNLLPISEQFSENLTVIENLNFNRPTNQSSSRISSAPPRPSTSRNLSPISEQFSEYLTVIENLNFNRPTSQFPSVSLSSRNQPRNQNGADVMDLPPSYESVMRADNLLPSNDGFSQVFEEQSQKY